MAKKPLVNSEPVSEFGDAILEQEGREIDLLEVPGFSAMRHQRDIELVEHRDGVRRGQDVSALPVNVRWVARGGGKTTGSVKLMRAHNNGYKPITKEMVGQHDWIKDLPPGATVQPDGTIVNAAGDLQLFYCDAPTAARNQARKARAAQMLVEQVGGGNLGDGAGGRLDTVTQFPGIIDPTVTREPVR